MQNFEKCLSKIALRKQTRNHIIIGLYEQPLEDQVTQSSHPEGLRGRGYFYDVIVLWEIQNAFQSHQKWLELFLVLIKMLKHKRLLVE